MPKYKMKNISTNISDAKTWNQWTMIISETKRYLRQTRCGGFCQAIIPIYHLDVIMYVAPWLRAG